MSVLSACRHIPGLEGNELRERSIAGSIADRSALAGISMLEDLPGATTAGQSERLALQLQLSVLARTGRLSL